MTAPVLSAAEIAGNPFIEFLSRYQFDSVAFVREVLGKEPEPYQIRILQAYDRGERRQSIRSGHGVGKTAVLAWIVVHALVFKKPCKIACTAPTGGQLFDALAAEIKTWLKTLPPAIRSLFDIKSERIELLAAPEEVFVSFRTSSIEKPEALAGLHSDDGWVLLIGDEASGIPDPIFESASGAMSGHNAMTLLAGNPVRSVGFFYDTHHSLAEFWFTTHISCVDSQRVSRDFIEDMRRRYGEHSNAFRVRVLGLFPLSDDDAVIPRELAEPALKRDVKAIKVRPIWGLDVGKDRDRSALAKRRGNVLMEKVGTWQGLDTMELSGRVYEEYKKTALDDRPSDINVDAIGLGAGVADRLRELGLPARAINVSELPAMTDRYRNLRAELWFKARAWFAARDCNIAGDEDLREELVAVTYKIPETNAKIQIQAKKDMKKSPDLADAFILTFATEAISAALGSEQQNVSWSKPIKRKIGGLV